MTDYIIGHEEALTWTNNELARFSTSSIYSDIATAILWTSKEDNGVSVPITAEKLVRRIEEEGMPLIRQHDPGLPSGNVLTAKAFTSADGVVFVAALVGYYDPENTNSFISLNINTNPTVTHPEKLPAVENGSLGLCYYVDPREVADEWSAEVLKQAELPVEKIEVSHNALEAAIELIRVTAPYFLLVWNPFTKAFAEEAGKDTYRATHKWIKHVLGRMKEHKNPVLSVASFQSGCEVQFLFRGTDVKKTYKAHGTFSLAAVQAAELISNMITANIPPARLVYEFNGESSQWYPSYAVLYDGRLVSDHNILIAIEQLPKSLSLGITKEPV